MRKVIGLVFGLVFGLFSSAYGATFLWDQPASGVPTGYALYVNDTEAWRGVDKTATVTLVAGANTLYVKAYNDVINPDGTKVQLFSVPSNQLLVNNPGAPLNFRFEMTGTITLTPVPTPVK